ncbi:MAG: DUF479 domain-containing protein [Deltaproteobacteria bacterium]|nr:DUF479 domain-containing protein [Deltaproteobacteria bacterium]
MNYLAHFFLSQETPAAIAGALLGDHVRGDPSRQLPGAIAAAVVRHRQIDAFTDHHPRARQSRQRIDASFHLVRPVMVDVFYDHFLARHWDRYSDAPLAEFAQRVHAALLTHLEYLPERIRVSVESGSALEWLTSYGDLEQVGRALRRAASRLRRPGRLGEGARELQRNYGGLEQDFLVFFPDVMSFVRQLPPAS